LYGCGEKEPHFHVKTPAVLTQNFRSFDAKLQEFLMDFNMIMVQRQINGKIVSAHVSETSASDIAAPTKFFDNFTFKIMCNHVNLFPSTSINVA